MNKITKNENLEAQISSFLNTVIDQEINLLDYAKKNKIPVFINGNLDKGWKGNVIEHLLNINKNNSKDTDLPGIEVKTTPVIIKNNKLVAKETTCLSVINTKEIISTTFENSKFYHKIKNILFIAINVTNPDYPKIESFSFFNLQNHKELLKEIADDYNQLAEQILDNIREGFSDDLNFSANFGKVIQPRPKTGKKGNYTWAFYLKKEFLIQILNNDFSEKSNNKQIKTNI
jgi:DNA mismatch repair endonuclease MutH